MVVMNTVFSGFRGFFARFWGSLFFWCMLCLWIPTASAQSLPSTPTNAIATAQTAIVDKGDVAWMLISTTLVLLMALPGLALFYSGMVRKKNALSILMQTALVFSWIAVLWLIYGYSVAFTGDNPFIGSLDKLFLHGVNIHSLADTFSVQYKLPEYVYFIFQLTFAGITGALIIGAVAERIQLGAILAFITFWFTCGYLPLAHTVWASSGFLFKKGALDFAGGTVVHINAGVAGILCAYFVGKRNDIDKHPCPPHNLVATFTGAALLWVGWFGFNAGSALEANATAALALTNTLLATAAAVIAWALLEHIKHGHASLVGLASGMVAGLVGITPAAGTVGPCGAIVIGAATSLACIWAVDCLKRRLGVDDSLDVFGVHGIGGIVGALLTGIFTSSSLGGVGYSSDTTTIGSQLTIQAISVLMSVGWIALVSTVGLFLVKTLCTLRVSEQVETTGLDTAIHGQSAYD